MAIPNSHATAFMRMPQSIQKTWRRGTMRGTDVLERIPNPGRHRYSAIEKISLRIDYEPIDAFQRSNMSTSFDEDEDEDQIRFWKENRGVWKELEQAVESAISNYIDSIKNELAGSNQKTLITYAAPCIKDINLDHVCTSAKEQQQLPQCEVHPEPPRSLVSFRDDKTVVPDDSVTITGEPSWEKIIEKSAKKAAKDAVASYQAALKKPKSGNRAKPPKIARSVANYVRT